MGIIWIIVIGFVAGIIARLHLLAQQWVAIIVLFVWNRLVAARVVSDPGAGPR